MKKRRNIKRVVTSLVITGMLLTGGVVVHTPQIEASTSQAKVKFLYKGNVTPSTLKVYKSASSKSKTLGSLKKYSTVEVIATNKSWSKIKYKKGYGWVPSKYIEYAFDVYIQSYIISPTNVYISYSKKSKKIGTLKNGNTVKVLQSIDGWHQIQYKNGLGWISDKNVELGIPVTGDMSKIPSVKGTTKHVDTPLFD